jgi:hypothetical protein
VAKVEKHLNVYKATVPARGTLLRADRREPPELRQLRRFTNYLTPSPGFASTDTWAAIMLWLRNTLINWAVFSPLFAAIAGVPLLYFALICLSGCWGESLESRWLAFGGFGIASLFCIYRTNVQVCICLPTHWKVDDPAAQTDPPGFGLAPRKIFRRIGLWSLLWSRRQACKPRSGISPAYRQRTRRRRPNPHARRRRRPHQPARRRRPHRWARRRG